MEHNAAVRSRELKVHPYMERSQKHTVKLTNIKNKREGRNRRFIVQFHLCKLEIYTHTKSQSIKLHPCSYISRALKRVSVKRGEGRDWA